MKYPYLFLLSLLCILAKAQDKLYLIDGSKKVVKIIEIGLDQVVYAELSESGAPFLNSKETVATRDIVLIEYKKGQVEIFNRPEKSSISTSQGLVTHSVKKTENQNFSSNLISLNTLALCIADISGFYEHILPNKKFGFGVMAAYNFNLTANDINLYISILNNGKKLYDVGGFANFYPSAFKRRFTLSYGIMIKYTAISFSKNVGNSTNVVYAPASGGQLATIFNFGTQSNLSKNVFVKTMIGLGGFTLKGEYKEQYNEARAEFTGTYYNFSARPKLYLGLNLGFFL